MMEQRYDDFLFGILQPKYLQNEVGRNIYKASMF